MPSLRKRVTSYFRQLSFHNEPREKRLNVNENTFITKYLQGHIQLKEGPLIISGKNPTDLPNYDLQSYSMGPDSVIGCYTGPNGGLTTVKRTEKHLSIADPDIDFIDTQEELSTVEARKTDKSPNRNSCIPIDNTTMVIKVAGQEYFVTNRKKRHNKSQSLGSLSDFNVEVDTTRIDLDLCSNNNNKNVKSLNDVKNSISSNSIGNGQLKEQRSDTSDRTCSSDAQPSADKAPSSRGPEASNSAKVAGRTGSGDTVHENDCSQRAAGAITCSVGESEARGSGTESSRKTNEERTNTENKRRRSRHSADGKAAKKPGDVSSGRLNDESETTNTSRIESEKSTLSVDGKRAKPDGKYEISKSKSEGNPFQHRKRGKIIRLAQRPTSTVSANTDSSGSGVPSTSDALLPQEWNRKSDHIYGISESLYDRNQVTKIKNGDPIADCFGIIARNDSAILAVADGVNWGEKACVAAKSAIHGCLHYLNKTIFNDTKPFENLIKTDAKDTTKSETPLHNTHITNTQEVFVCLLRAFNCAHDLILENNGMLTTLTVAIILPLKQSNVKVDRETARPDAPQRRPTAQEKDEPNSYVCCVCNVGDTLAYVYSQKHGIRELTKGSHDINCNRDMRDALGALGPVDGINPELSNLTLSVTTIQKGDIVLIASDGLTDNFDPNVCKFTVNTNANEAGKPKRPQSAQAPAKKEPRHTSSQAKQHKVHAKSEKHQKVDEKNRPPVKPPRRNYTKGRDSSSRSSAERSVRSGSEESTRARGDSKRLGEEGGSKRHGEKAAATGGSKRSEQTSKIEESSKRRNSTTHDHVSKTKETSEIKEPQENSVKNHEIISADGCRIPEKINLQEDKENSSNAQNLTPNTDSNQAGSTHNQSNGALLNNTVQIVTNLEANFTTHTSSSNANDGRSDPHTSAADPSDNSSSVDVSSRNKQPSNVVDKDEPDHSVREPELSNPLIAQFIRENSVDESSSLEKCKESLLQKTEPVDFHDKPIKRLPSHKSVPPSQRKPEKQQPVGKTLSINRNADAKPPESKPDNQRYGFLRSKTSLDLRTKPICRNEDGIAYVTPVQRYELTLLLIEDVLRHGISGREPQCISARKLCENLLNFTFSITAAKRHTLEDNDLYFDNQSGLLVEISSHEKKVRRKLGLERVQNLPGKLDHVTVVAFNVGNFSF